MPVSADRLRLLPRSTSRTVVVRRSFAAFRETLVRVRAPGIATMVVGAAAVATGMLAVGGSLALIVGAGMGVLGIYWTLQPISSGSGRRAETAAPVRERDAFPGRVTFTPRARQNGTQANLALPHRD